MLRGIKGLLMTGVVMGGLAGCVDPSLTATNPADAAAIAAAAAAEAKLTAPLANAEIYASKMDGSFVVPAVPVEKVPAHLQRQAVDFPTSDAPGTVIIDPANKLLHLVTGPNKAIRYGIAVGKAGFEWSGEALITDRKHWPTWTPPKEMIERKPELSKWEDGQPGGPTNPLGARALYLTTNGVDYGYRIHGTPEWNSIGSNASSGCIRMINQDVMDLYERVPDGAKVVVLNRDGSRPSGLKLPPPAPTAAKKAKPAAAKPVVTPVVAPATPAPIAMPPLTTPAAPPPIVVVPTAPVVTSPPVTASGLPPLATPAAPPPIVVAPAATGN